MEPKQLSAEELVQLMYQTIGYLMVHYRANIIGLLQKDGYDINASATDSKVRATIVAAIRDSEPFRTSLADLMLASAQLEANGSSENTVNASGPSTNGGNIHSLFQQGEKFKNASGDGLLPGCTDPSDPTCYGYDITGTTQQPSSSYTGSTYGSGSSGSSSSGSSSSGGGFFSNLFTADTTKNLINSGLSYLSASINSKTQSQTQTAAVQIAQAQAAAAQAAAQAAAVKASATTTTPGWVWPVVIGVPVAIVLTVVLIAVLKKKKVA